MKTNSEIWEYIFTCLKAASDAGMYAFWRERFNTNHPDCIRHQEIDNLMQFARANWFAARGLYCKHKDQMDKHCEALSQMAKHILICPTRLLSSYL